MRICDKYVTNIYEICDENNKGFSVCFKIMKFFTLGYQKNNKPDALVVWYFLQSDRLVMRP